MAKHGKRYRQTTALLEREEKKSYSPQEAVALVKKLATARFDETIELHIRTSCDPRHQDQMVRGTTSLPHGTGRQVRVLVFTQGEGVELAGEAGAEYVGGTDLVRRIQEGWTDFDVAIATPDMMPHVSRLGRILGPRGLMPNPRAGTVVPPEDLPRAIREAKGGRIEYRLDRQGLIHVPIGKASFSEEQLLGNMATIMDAVVRARPPGVRGQYILSVHLAPTMGPSVPVDVAQATSLRVE